MPELPDIVIYIDALTERIAGEPLERVHIGNPFIVRTIDPPPTTFERRRVLRLRRMGKRVVFEFAGDLFMVVHRAPVHRDAAHPRGVDRTHARRTRQSLS